jgi:hypothetical protein
MRFFGAVRDSRGKFPEKPIVVRKGAVAKRRDLTQTLHIGSARLGIRAPQISLVLFHIDCDDEHGREQIIVLIERDEENQSVDVGNSVVVTSQESVLDSSYAYRSVRLKGRA